MLLTGRELDTVDANHALGFTTDCRDSSLPAAQLDDRGGNDYAGGHQLHGEAWKRSDRFGYDRGESMT